MSASSTGSSRALSRRGFLEKSTATAAAALLARPAAAAARFVPAGERIKLAYIGCGTQGFRQLMPALESSDLQVVAVCDPMRRSDDYPDYGNEELNNKIRKFLGDPNWAKGARGALCGREPGQEIVNRYYAKHGQSAGCRAYVDYRELLQKERDLEAVYIMTPEHLHGVIAVHAMRAGKHVITHKPIANVLQEVRIVRDTARATGVATHLFCAAGQTSTPALCEWLAAGAIGDVREVHNWSTRPFWPQGMIEPPRGMPPVPEDFEWDLWLGPAAERPYHPDYTHAVFRGWYDFGTGALGDMGHYSFHQIFEALQLGSPLTVEAGRSQVWRITNYRWRREIAHVAYPHASQIRWQFPARGTAPPVALYWYDGGLRPPTIPELEEDGVEMPGEGVLYVGTTGKILAEFSGAKPRLLPAARMHDFQPPPPNLPRPIGELEQFIRACRGGPPSDASFENAYPFAETILLGTIALRVNKKLRWDAAQFAFTNSKEANALIARKNRPGWELESL
jgi:predicted dehydrogenase